jgi:hypothetical protein
MIDLLSCKKHVITKGDTLFLQNDTFLNGAFYNYRVEEHDAVIIATDKEEGPINPPMMHRFIFDNVGTFVIKLTKQGYKPSDDVRCEIEVVVE